MKLNMDIEIDYINEEGTIDDAVKEAIINKIVDTVLKKNQEKIEDTVANVAKEKADKLCDEMIADFLEKKRTITDGYGDAIETDITINEILKKRFDEFWNTKVNDNGKLDGYGLNRTRIAWTIDERIKEHSKQFAQTLTRDTENKIKNNMKDSLSKSIGAKLVSELEFDKLLIESKST